MRELKLNEIEQVNGGIVDEAGYVEDALVIGGGTLAGAASAAISAPVAVIAVAVASAYYIGKGIGRWMVSSGITVSSAGGGDKQLLQF